MEPEIVNVVATADLKQRVDLKEVSGLPHTIHDQEIYGGRVAYLNTPEMHGKVTIFPSGKLISVGTKSPSQAEDDLKTTHDVLNENGLIEPTQIVTSLRNLVAVLSLDRPIDLESLPTQPQAIYEPEQFPGAIIRSTDLNATYLVFSSGKIVISGTRSPQELQKAAEKIAKIL